MLGKNEKIIIYGAGKIGQRIYDLCMDQNIEVVAVWDNYPEKVLQFSNKNILRKPPLECNISKDTTIIVTPFSQNMARSIVSQLKKMGFKKIIYDRSIISDMLARYCANLQKYINKKVDLKECFICPARRDAKIECEVFNNNIGNFHYEDHNHVSFHVMGFLVTTNCNLTCVGCNHLRDHFEPKHNVNFDVNNIFSDLQKIISAVDFIKSLVVVGGESFMHPELEEILRAILSLPKIGFIQIITNGTVVPKNKKVFEVLANSRIFVEISGYGNKLSEKLVKKRKQFFEKLDEYKINYRYDEVFQWIDFGGFEKRNYSITQWQEIYNNCCFVSNDLFDGKLHKCSRSAYGQMLGKLPIYTNDYLDIRNSQPGDLRQQIIKYLKVIPQVCYHCNGTCNIIIPAGKQLRRSK